MLFYSKLKPQRLNTEKNKERFFQIKVPLNKINKKFVDKNDNNAKYLLSKIEADSIDNFAENYILKLIKISGCKSITFWTHNQSRMIKSKNFENIRTNFDNKNTFDNQSSIKPLNMKNPINKDDFFQTHLVCLTVSVASIYTEYQKLRKFFVIYPNLMFGHNSMSKLYMLMQMPIERIRCYLYERLALRDSDVITAYVNFNEVTNCLQTVPNELNKIEFNLNKKLLKKNNEEFWSSDFDLTDPKIVYNNLVATSSFYKIKP